MTRLAGAWRRWWAGLRSITGDDAYERYLDAPANRASR